MIETSEKENLAFPTPKSPYAKLRNTDFNAVRWGNGFWGKRYKQCTTTTLPHLYQCMADPQTGHALTNFEIKAGLRDGEFVGTFWQDEWVYKWLEAASYIYADTQDSQLDQTLDRIIDLVARSQDPDGYTATQIMLVKERYTKTYHHEMYVMGHQITAACVHHQLTGKDNFLQIAIRTANHLCDTFMPPRDSHLDFFGRNPSYIMALVDLYRLVKDDKYLALAAELINMRGCREGGPGHATRDVGTDQTQARVPLREETHVVGHAVFFTYLFAGAADVYMETGDKSLLEALDRLWLDLVEKKMYINGGVSAIHQGRSIRSDETCEAAGYDYVLPNSSAYNETCGQIGNFFWNWRMLLIHGEARFGDIMERTIYNSILSGNNLEDNEWFYTNVLRCYGKDHNSHLMLVKEVTHRSQPAGNKKTRDEICCPSNSIRTFAGLSKFLYAISDEGIYCNLYGESRFEGQLTDGSALQFSQETNYPWEGKITFRISQAPSHQTSFFLRIPHWADHATITLNDKPVEVSAAACSFAKVTAVFQSGDQLILNLPMKPRLMVGHERLEECRNHVAVTRGPLLYCLESPDLPQGIRVPEIAVSRRLQLTSRFEENLLHGVTVLEGQAWQCSQVNPENQLYRELDQAPPQALTIRLIPYFAWANRGISEMTVWLPLLD